MNVDLRQNHASVSYKMYATKFNNKVYSDVICSIHMSDSTKVIDF